eukprot:2839784-Rhodomonas_salina.1
MLQVLAPSLGLGFGVRSEAVGASCVEEGKEGHVSGVLSSGGAAVLGASWLLRAMLLSHARWWLWCGLRVRLSTRAEDRGRLRL